jgi:hypothetical protein
VEVAFVRMGWVVRVQRVVPKGASAAEFALRELTQGPTKAERRKGIRTALPDRARGPLRTRAHVMDQRISPSRRLAARKNNVVNA